MEEIEAVPNPRAADLIYMLENPRFAEEQDSARQELLAIIKEDEMAPLYKLLQLEKPSLGFESEIYDAMALKNEAKANTLKRAIEDAKEAEDEIALIEEWVKLGNHYARICDREKALETLRHALTLTANAGSRIDVRLTIIRLGLFFNDKHLTNREVQDAEKLVNDEGDWERKNRYKTYRGIHLMSIRQFGEAANLLIDSFATFTSTELIPYNQVVACGVACGAFALERTELKKRVVDSPEALALLPTTSVLEPLTEMTNSLYTGEYSIYLKALARVEQEFLLKSRFLAPHATFYVREMRVKAYAQLLESYMALNLKSMAETFGVGIEFLDADLSSMIPQKKLNCVVDKVNGVIVTNRPDSKNALYQQLIKNSDALLTKLQKYGAAVRLHGSDQI